MQCKEEACNTACPQVTLPSRADRTPGVSLAPRLPGPVLELSFCWGHGAGQVWRSAGCWGLGPGPGSQKETQGAGSGAEAAFALVAVASDDFRGWGLLRRLPGPWAVKKRTGGPESGLGLRT